MDREEAINVVRCNWPEGRHQLSEALKTLIPEFQESEDEKIRKALIEVFEKKLEKGFEWVEYGIPNRSVLNWLVKQKEQKPLSTEETELNSIAFLEQLGYTCVPPGAEQKTAEWSEEDEKMLNSAIHLVELDERAAEYVGKVKISDVLIWLKSLRPQPHWKPSKEDEERLINTSISFLKDFADKGYENAVECIDWLKSKLNGNSGK